MVAFAIFVLLEKLIGVKEIRVQSIAIFNYQNESFDVKNIFMRKYTFY